MNQIEIEQKFLFSYIPFNEYQCCEKTVVFRKYLSVNPEIRINRRVFESREERFHLTIKSDELLAREEIKICLTEEEYSEISNFIRQQPMVIEIYNFKIDADHSMSFKQIQNSDISFAEIEYRSYDDYQNLKNIIGKLPFLGTDVTWDKDYYMKNIWAKQVLDGLWEKSK